MDNKKLNQTPLQTGNFNMSEELAKQNKLLLQRLHSVSNLTHDLRNSTASLDVIRYILKNKLNDDKSKEFYKIACTELEKMKILLKSLDQASKGV